MSEAASPEGARISEAGADALPAMEDRDRTADDRDKTAQAVDDSAAERDMRSEDRDLRAEARDERDGTVDVEAASDRAGARRDRQGAASDRRQAEDDRDAADTDRRLSAAHRESLLHDALTGTYRREAGVMELEREVVKAARTGEPFTLAFIDVDGLKAVNDADGHQAGDELLRGVADHIRAVVREYDVVVRWGGDEFVCGLLGLGLDAAVRRFEEMGRSLGLSGSSATVGLAQARPGEDLDAVIARADASMYSRKANATDGPRA